MNKPLLLIILDGFGIAEKHGNAIKAANKPNLDRIFSQNPITQIQASSMSVGLPEGQMGNSEVGHTNIGAGRIAKYGLVKKNDCCCQAQYLHRSGLQPVQGRPAAYSRLIR